MKIEDCKILVLKDEEVSSTTKQMLLRMGVKEDNIFLANNLQEAKNIIISTRFNLVLTGIGINETKGIALLEWLKVISVRSLISFIFYSGGGEHYIRQKVEEYGADGYISLPADMVTLELKLREILLKK